jgi:paraquat-inducible protein A
VHRIPPPRAVAGTELIACHACDLLQRAAPVPVGGAARCARCGSVLYRHRPNSLERTLALVIAGLILFAVANAFPFLSFRMQGQVVQTTLISGVRDLSDQGMTALAVLVLVTTVLAPCCQLLALLYVLLPLRLRRRAPGSATVFRWVRRVQPWSMMEVFMLGVLVSLVKLADMAEIIPGIALWSFALLIVALTATTAALDPAIVWRRLAVRG